MQRVRLNSLNDFAEWRATARALLLATIRPEEVIWEEPAAVEDLFAEPAASVPQVTNRAVGTVPQRFVGLAEDAICHTDPERFALLYRLLWRLVRDTSLLAVRSDPDVEKLYRRVAAVRRDAHKMTAFVRFRSVPGTDGLERYAAWFEPDHYVLERTAPFFVRRFTGMHWAIVTPYRSAAWDGEALTFAEGGSKGDVPSEDAAEAVWKTYFASIFNPARLKVKMMQSEMPKKYWRNLPEAELIPSLIKGARQAEEEMLEKHATQPPSRHVRQAMRQEPVNEYMDEIKSLGDARSAVQGCRRCPLYEHATQAVFGEGPARADVMFVGEQPGDQEDLAGKPFVGQAGKIFDAAIERVGIERSRVYVTNAVKHFKFEPRGKKRIHQRPNAGEVEACKFWLNLERELVRPRLIVALGATAAQSLLGKTATISKLRGKPIALDGNTTLFVTVHPSYLLRIPEHELAEAERGRFEDDLRAVRKLAETLDKAA